MASVKGRASEESSTMFHGAWEMRLRDAKNAILTT